MYEIDRSTLRKATKCAWKCQCAKEGVCGSDRDCSIKSYHNVPDIFVCENSVVLCPYMIRFGDTSFCTCPVRQELLLKYGV